LGRLLFVVHSKSQAIIFINIIHMSGILIGGLNGERRGYDTYFGENPE
jgi:hypothetical protein